MGAFLVGDSPISSFEAAFYFHCCQYTTTTDTPQVMMVPVTIFQLYDGVKATGIQQELGFEFPSSTKLVTRSMMLSRDAGQGHWAAAPSQPRYHEGKQPIQWQPFYFVLLAQYSITWNIQLGSVLDDFAQLYANVYSERV